jgi:hypothetical protein
MKDVSNVYWTGGIFDCAMISGDNGISVTMSSNIHISNVEIKNCLQAPFPLLGGRGVSFHPGSISCSLKNATVYDSSVNQLMGKKI